MREIKFRAWKKNGGLLKWETGFTLSENGRVYSIGGGYVGSSDITDQVILMQFTGLHDKNGKEIFEGDIMSVENEVNNMQVCWSVGFAGFSLRRKDWVFQHFFSEAVEVTQCEIIGNIYENPEHLK